MPNFIVTAFMEFEKAGWTENYYQQATDYTTALAGAQVFNTKRMALSGPDVKCTGLRASNVEIFRDSVLANATTPAGTYVFGGAGDATAQAELSIQLRIEAGTLKRSTRFIHGIPTAQISGSNFTPSTSYNTSLTAFINSLISSSDIASINPPASRPPKYSFETVTAITVRFLATKKVGRPFDLFHGRRRIR